MGMDEQACQAGNEQDMNAEVGKGKFKMPFEIPAFAGQPHEDQKNSQGQARIDKPFMVEVILSQYSQRRHGDTSPGGQVGNGKAKDTQVIEIIGAEKQDDHGYEGR